jgi:hypothetical protein
LNPKAASSISNISTISTNTCSIQNQQVVSESNEISMEIHETLNEQVNTQVNTQVNKTLVINGINAKSLDFSQNVNDPTVHLMGLGLRPVSRLKKEIQEDLIKFANLVGNRDAKDLMVYLTDVEGKYSSNMYFAYKLQALMEIEEFLKRPEVKRKITLMKKRG